MTAKKIKNAKDREKIYPTHRAKAELSNLIREVLSGVDVIIAKGKESLVRLVPIKQKNLKRQIGIEKGKFYMADDFNAAISDFDEYK